MVTVKVGAPGRDRGREVLFVLVDYRVKGVSIPGGEAEVSEKGLLVA